MEWHPPAGQHGRPRASSVARLRQQTVFEDFAENIVFLAVHQACTANGMLRAAVSVEAPADVGMHFGLPLDSWLMSGGATRCLVDGVRTATSLTQQLATGSCDIYYRRYGKKSLRKPWTPSQPALLLRPLNGAL